MVIPVICRTHSLGIVSAAEGRMPSRSKRGALLVQVYVRLLLKRLRHT